MISPLKNHIKDDIANLSAALSFFYDDTTKTNYQKNSYSFTLESNTTLSNGTVIPKIVKFVNNTYEGNITVEDIKLSLLSGLKLNFDISLYVSSLDNKESYNMKLSMNNDEAIHFVSDANISFYKDEKSITLKDLKFETYGIIEAIDENFSNPNYDDVYFVIKSTKLNINSDEIDLDGNITATYKQKDSFETIEFVGKIDEKQIALKASIINNEENFTSTNIKYNLVFDQNNYTIDAGYKFFEQSDIFDIKISKNGYEIIGDMSIDQDESIKLSAKDTNDIFVDLEYKDSILNGSVSKYEQFIGKIDNNRGFPAITYTQDGYEYFESVF
jgi:hypothetical protein